MSEFNDNNLNILDLSDEVLLIILNKLNKIDVLHSLVYVNHRFHRLVLDPLYIRNLDMIDMTNINTLYDQMSSTDAQSLSRFSDKIVPRIHQLVQKLAIEQYLTKEILSRNYPLLCSLSLVNCQEEILYQYITDDPVFRDVLIKGITHLNIDMRRINEQLPKTVSDTFALILSVCEKLIDFNFGDMFLTRRCPTPIFCSSSLLENCTSSTLIKLKINVVTILDILLLLDARLESLSTLIITVSRIYDDDLDELYNGPRRKLFKLKCFSLTVLGFTHAFNSVIVPLLCRMINLEELQLYALVKRFDWTYVDGYQLFDGFLVYMTQLSKFTFSIKTNVRSIINLLELPTNEDIQRSFIGRYNQQVASYVQNDLTRKKGSCHIYTVPYEFEYFYEVDNSFQRGMFRKVRYLTMEDRDAFQYELFQLVSEEFPLLESLVLSNPFPMEDKQHSITPITFPCLTLLDLKCAHLHYVQLFLLKKNLHLPCLLNLVIKYESLTMITNNFTNDATDFNFERLKSLDVCQSFVRPKNFRNYFPLL